jgi:hypothetical protein
MYLAKQLTSRSLPGIGRKFGNRDHTTVMHAVSRVTEFSATIRSPRTLSAAVSADVVTNPVIAGRGFISPYADGAVRSDVKAVSEPIAVKPPDPSDDHASNAKQARLGESAPACKVAEARGRRHSRRSSLNDTVAPHQWESLANPRQ